MVRRVFGDDVPFPHEADIAPVSYTHLIIGATQKNDGYLSGNGYMVTWAFGHLSQLAMPEAYGVANFRRESLPILPRCV